MPDDTFDADAAALTDAEPVEEMLPVPVAERHSDADADRDPVPDAVFDCVSDALLLAEALTELEALPHTDSVPVGTGVDEMDAVAESVLVMVAVVDSDDWKLADAAEERVAEAQGDTDRDRREETVAKERDEVGEGGPVGDPGSGPPELVAVTDPAGLAVGDPVREGVTNADSDRSEEAVAHDAELVSEYVAVGGGLVDPVREGVEDVVADRHSVTLCDGEGVVVVLEHRVAVTDVDAEPDVHELGVGV